MKNTKCLECIKTSVSLGARIFVNNKKEKNTYNVANTLFRNVFYNYVTLRIEFLKGL